MDKRDRIGEWDGVGKWNKIKMEHAWRVSAYIRLMGHVSSEELFWLFGGNDTRYLIQFSMRINPMLKSLGGQRVRYVSNGKRVRAWIIREELTQTSGVE